jgi:4-hydroxy-tetrahydrodipicolinate synthase
MKIEGIITALITPFDDRGEVDEGALKKLIDFQIKGGVNGLFLCGTAGLGAIMRQDQRIQTFRVAAKHSRGRIPLVAQVGAPSTEETVNLAKEAETAGVDALGCVTPYYITPDDESMLTHYKAILASVKLPIYVYNIPRNAINNVSPELMRRLVEAGIAGVKDSSRDFVQVMEYLHALPTTSTVICGTDSYILPALLMGAKGAITGYANAFPEVYAQLWKAYKEGKSEEARQLQFRINSLRKLLQKPAISPHYEALRMRGINCGNPRAPLRAMTEKEAQSLKEQLTRLGVL